MKTIKIDRYELAETILTNIDKIGDCDYIITVDESGTTHCLSSTCNFDDHYKIINLYEWDRKDAAYSSIREYGDWIYQYVIKNFDDIDNIKIEWITE